MNRARLEKILPLVAVVVAVLAPAGAASAATVNVVSVQQLVNAVLNAAPGDVITIAPAAGGNTATYDLSGSPELNPKVDVTIRGGGSDPSKVVLEKGGIFSFDAHVLVENLTIDGGLINTDGGSLVFRNGTIIQRRRGPAVEGDFGPLTLVDTEIVGVNGLGGSFVSGFGIFYDGGPGPDGFGGLTLVNVQIHGFGVGIALADSRDPIQIVDTQVFGNETACEIFSTPLLVTSGLWTVFARPNRLTRANRDEESG